MSNDLQLPPGDDHTDDEARDERGLVVIYFGLVLTLMIVMCGFALDIGNWYYHASKLQKTADAAALGGAVYLPGNAGQATTVATQVAKENNYPVGGINNVAVTATPVAGRPTQLKVSVTETVKSWFAQVIGIRSETLTRSAVAEYEQPVDMGSPANVFGTEAVAGTDATWSNVPAFVPHLWGNVYGQAKGKSSGDAIQSTTCDGASLDECQAGVNLDYSASGYFYKVTVDPAQVATHAGELLAIEVFDPAATVVGDHCDNTTSGLENTATATNPFVPTAAEAAVRYGWGDSSNTPNSDSSGAWCTGDNGTATTTYVVRQGLNLFDPSNQPVVGSPATGASQTSGCPGEQFGSWAPPDNLTSGLGNLLHSTDPNYDAHLGQLFRQWVPICVFDPSTAAAPAYLVQVRTNISPTNSQALMEGAASSPGDSGGNRFAIRAAWVQNTGSGAGSGVAFTPFTANGNPKRSAGDPYVGGYPVVPRPVYLDNAGISVSGSTAMGLYANAAGGTTPNYYMARVQPGSTGQTLEIRMWDTGDGSFPSGYPKLTFHLPASMGGGIPTCTWLKDDGPPGGSGVGAAQSTLFTNGSCTSPVSGGNGLWYTVDIAVPNNYTCNQNTYTDCWFTMTYDPGGGTFSDTTTWGARLLGNPVRLVQ